MTRTGAWLAILVLVLSGCSQEQESAPASWETDLRAWLTDDIASTTGEEKADACAYLTEQAGSTSVEDLQAHFLADADTYRTDFAIPDSVTDEEIAQVVAEEASAACED